MTTPNQIIGLHSHLTIVISCPCGERLSRDFTVGNLVSTYSPWETTIEYTLVPYESDRCPSCQFVVGTISVTTRKVESGKLR